MSDPHLQVVEPVDFECSIISEARDTVTRVIGFRDALSGIKTGRWAKKVEAVREAYETGGKDAAAAPKKLLPGILFSGTFHRRAAEAIDKHCGLICADLDHLGDRVSTLKEHLIADDHVLAVFVSPTGSGLKVIFRCDPTKDHKLETFPALEKYVADNFGELIDEKCDDVSRICFVSHDPELWANDDAKVIPYPPPEPRQAPKDFVLKPKHISGDDLMPGEDFNTRGATLVPDILESHGWTHLRGIYWCRPGKSGGVSATWGYYDDTFIVHSSATETGFPSERKGFDPFGVYTHMEHSGDWRAAGRELRRKGYGSSTKPKTKQQFNLERVAAPDAPPPPEPTELESRRITLASKPVEPTTRLFLAGKPIATPGNLVTLISRAKTGKTATIGSVVAAIIGAHYDRKEIDTFGFTAPHTTEAVVLIDTEQSPFDAFTCHQRAFARANQSEDIDWLCHYALVGYDAAKLRASLPKILEAAKAKHGAVFTLILDGVADFVASVNDEAECNDFISYLRSLAVLYDCPIICVIHSNEALKSGDDGRGHLGKQLTRKAESNLLLKKVGEVTQITSEKQRKAPITADDGIAFKWSDEHGRHISCEASTPVSKGGRPKGVTFQSLESIWPRTADKALTQAQLLKFAKDEEEISEATLRRIIKDAVADGQLIKTPSTLGSKYHLKF